MAPPALFTNKEGAIEDLALIYLNVLTAAALIPLAWKLYSKGGAKKQAEPNFVRLRPPDGQWTAWSTIAVVPRGTLDRGNPMVLSSVIQQDCLIFTDFSEDGSNGQFTLYALPVINGPRNTWKTYTKITPPQPLLFNIMAIMTMPEGDVKPTEYYHLLGIKGVRPFGAMLTRMTEAVHRSALRLLKPLKDFRRQPEQTLREQLSSAVPFDGEEDGPLPAVYRPSMGDAATSDPEPQKDIGMTLEATLRTSANQQINNIARQQMDRCLRLISGQLPTEATEPKYRILEDLLDLMVQTEDVDQTTRPAVRRAVQRFAQECKTVIMQWRQRDEEEFRSLLGLLLPMGSQPTPRQDSLHLQPGSSIHVSSIFGPSHGSLPVAGSVTGPMVGGDNQNHRTEIPRTSSRISNLSGFSAGPFEELLRMDSINGGDIAAVLAEPPTDSFTFSPHPNHGLP